MEQPKVFISYSWDSEAHKAWVKSLADRLMGDGVNITLDQYDLLLGRNLTHYMEEAVDKADKIILILTENYKIKAEGRTGGVGYEYSMINAEWYKKQTANNKFIPILRQGTHDTAIPRFVDSYIYGDMRDGGNFEEAYQMMVRTIYNSPRHMKPKIGKPPIYVQPTQEESPSPSETRNPIIHSLDVTHPHKAPAKLKEQLQRMVGANEIQTTIDQIIQFGKETNNTSLTIQATQIQQRYTNQTSDELGGLFSRAENAITKNKIVYALLQLIEKM